MTIENRRKILAISIFSLFAAVFVLAYLLNFSLHTLGIAIVGGLSFSTLIYEILNSYS